MSRDRRIFRRIMWGLLVVVVVAAAVQTSFFVRLSGRPALFVKLRVGMTKAEVRKVIGDPTGVAGRVLGRMTTRDIWEYQEEVSGAKHYLVFHNNVLIGWDLPHPFAEDPYTR